MEHQNSAETKAAEYFVLYKKSLASGKELAASIRKLRAKNAAGGITNRDDFVTTLAKLKQQLQKEVAAVKVYKAEYEKGNDKHEEVETNAKAAMNEPFHDEALEVEIKELAAKLNFANQTDMPPAQKRLMKEKLASLVYLLQQPKAPNNEFTQKKTSEEAVAEKKMAYGGRAALHAGDWPDCKNEEAEGSKHLCESNQHDDHVQNGMAEEETAAEHDAKQQVARVQNEKAQEEEAAAEFKSEQHDEHVPNEMSEEEEMSVEEEAEAEEKTEQHDEHVQNEMSKKEETEAVNGHDGLVEDEKSKDVNAESESEDNDNKKDKNDAQRLEVLHSQSVARELSLAGEIESEIAKVRNGEVKDVHATSQRLRRLSVQLKREVRNTNGYEVKLRKWYDKTPPKAQLPQPPISSTKGGLSTNLEATAAEDLEVTPLTSVAGLGDGDPQVAEISTGANDVQEGGAQTHQETLGKMHNESVARAEALAGTIKSETAKIRKGEVKDAHETAHRLRKMSIQLKKEIRASMSYEVARDKCMIQSSLPQKKGTKARLAKLKNFFEPAKSVEQDASAPDAPAGLENTPSLFTDISQKEEKKKRKKKKEKKEKKKKKESRTNEKATVDHVGREEGETATTTNGSVKEAHKQERSNEHGQDALVKENTREEEEKEATVTVHHKAGLEETETTKASEKTNRKIWRSDKIGRKARTKKKARGGEGKELTTEKAICATEEEKKESSKATRNQIAYPPAVFAHGHMGTKNECFMHGYARISGDIVNGAALYSNKETDHFIYQHKSGRWYFTQSRDSVDNNCVSVGSAEPADLPTGIMYMYHNGKALVVDPDLVVSPITDAKKHLAASPHLPKGLTHKHRKQEQKHSGERAKRFVKIDDKVVQSPATKPPVRVLSFASNTDYGDRGKAHSKSRRVIPGLDALDDGHGNADEARTLVGMLEKMFPHNPDAAAAYAQALHEYGVESVAEFRALATEELDFAAIADESGCTIKRLHQKRILKHHQKLQQHISKKHQRLHSSHGKRKTILQRPRSAVVSTPPHAHAACPAHRMYHVLAKQMYWRAHGNRCLTESRNAMRMRSNHAQMAMKVTAEEKTSLDLRRASSLPVEGDMVAFRNPLLARQSSASRSHKHGRHHRHHQHGGHHRHHHHHETSSRGRHDKAAERHAAGKHAANEGNRRSSPKIRSEQHHHRGSKHHHQHRHQRLHSRHRHSVKDPSDPLAYMP